VRNQRRGTWQFIGAVAATAALLAVAVPALAAGTLTMTGFTPASGPVGTVVTITGTGFVSGDIVAFNGTRASGSTANTAGTTLKASVPAFATSGVISVTDPSSGQTAELPNSPFTVTTGAFASPKRDWPGGLLTFSASKLTPNSRETIFIGKTQVAVGVTDFAGDLQLQVMVPAKSLGGRAPVYADDPRVGEVRFPIYIIGDWPQFGRDAARSGFDTFETSLSTSTVAGLKSKWTNGQVLGEFEPVVANGLVFSITQSVDPSAYDAVTGTSKWLSNSFGTGTITSSMTDGQNGLVYVAGQACTAGGGCGCPMVEALSETTGSTIWQRCVGGIVRTAAAVVNNIAYVGSDDGNVYALDAKAGFVVWKYNTGSPVRSAPALAGNIVYVGSDNHKVYALRALNGAFVWSYSTGGSIESAPTFANGFVYVGSNDGNLYALMPSNGAFAWSYPVGMSFAAAGAGAAGIVYAASGPDIVALNSTGSLVWFFNTGGSASAPALASGVLYFGSADSHIYAVDAATGAQLWSYSMGGRAGAPAIANGMVYVPVENVSPFPPFRAFGL
jgi:outer membrane protein assembly factor BamB